LEGYFPSGKLSEQSFCSLVFSASLFFKSFSNSSLEIQSESRAASLVEAAIVVDYYLQLRSLVNNSKRALLTIWEPAKLVKMPRWSNIEAILLHPGTFTDTILLSSGYFLQKRAIR
jgi:hypothetical protein